MSAKPETQTELQTEIPASSVMTVTLLTPTTPSPKPKQRRGFAAMDPALVREIARKGGEAAHANGTAHEFTQAEAKAAGRKGGLAVHAKAPRTSHHFGIGPLPVTCSFCGGPATGCQYGPRTIACWRCTKEAWAWVRSHTGKSPRRREGRPAPSASFYEAAGRR